MKISLKKPSIIIAIITTIILILALVFIPKTSMFSSLIEQLNLKEGTEEEVSLDNWEISTVFYDSTVDEGKTPLTEINWDASDGSYKTGETRIITVQINYKNTNAVTTYQPGELEISIPNLIYCHEEYIDGEYIDVYTGGYFAHWDATVVVGANDSTHTGYDWDLKNASKPSSSLEKLTFTNTNLIEEKTNFEGSIQIVYTITPTYEGHELKHSFEYEDECTHTLLMNITAILNQNLKSNQITMDYKRVYTHPWQLAEYTIEKKASKISSFDGLPSGDYYWVKYIFNIKTNPPLHSLHYPYMSAEYYISDKLPADCVVLDSAQNILDLNGENYIDNSFTRVDNNYWEEFIYVGYPKTMYNENKNNLEITNSVDLYLKYHNEEEFSYNDSSEISLNLSDYEFKYEGELYSINKGTHSEPHWGPNYNYYQSLTGEKIDIGTKGSQTWYLYSKSIYNGQNYDLKIGDDLLYITRDNGKIEKLNDDEYYFSKIYFPSNLYNGNNKSLKKDKYNCELWVRYKDTNEYVLHTKFTNSIKSWSFTKSNKINGFYILIKDIDESIVMNSQTSYIQAHTTINNAKNISQSGTIYNFNYIEAYIDNKIQNIVDISNYNNTLTQLDIASNDMETYGKYQQRSFSTNQYSYCKNIKLSHILYGEKEMEELTQDSEKEEFIGSTTLSFIAHEHDAYGHGYSSANTFDYSDYIHLSYSTKFNYDEGFTGFEIYDLLPIGMELKSTEEDILNSLYVKNLSTIYNIDQQKLNQEALKKIIQDNTSIIIQNNYNNTNRTMIKIRVDLINNPIYNLDFSYGAYRPVDWISFSYNYSIPYDAYLEYGSNWNNSAAFFFVGNEGRYYNSKIDEEDINENENTTEKYSYTTDKVTITSIVSTHQDTTTYVKTDKSNHSTGVVEASYDSEYEYKLRARTGSANVTNLILYTNIEEGHNGRGHWKGEFLGIDTTYAESKGYTIKTYYSEKTNATNMKDDTSWKEYTDTTDKTKVKSLAFVYLDETGKPAILPENSLTYVLIKMKSPADESIKTIAYNSSWTEWTALDDSGEEVDFITGINSNTVKISLPNSVQYEDIEINLEKIWDDNNNQLGLRPNEITYQIIPNNDSTKAINFILNNNDTSLTDPNKWTKTIEVPKYDDNGDEIEYTINEVIPTLENNYTYIKTINNYSITNQLAKNLTITKKWIDNSNSYLTRPSNVVIKVLQNNKEYKTVTITGDYTTNEWSNNIAVPVYDAEGNEYTYTLEELKVDNYSTTYDSTNLTFTNKLTGEEKITITKEWLDNSNTYNTRPLSIDINLNQNNKLYKKITLSGTTNIWKSNEITVPKYDDNGIKYNYTIEEINTLNEYGLIDYDQNSFKITNKLKNTTNITITKTWIDGDNAYNTRPKDLTITLLQNGKEYKTITLNGTTNTWTTSIEVPKYDENQSTYKYTIKEVNEEIISIYSDISYSEDGFSITNRLNEEIDLTITKKWIDNNNEYKTRPSTVKINLYQDDIIYKSLELSGDTDTWTTEIKDVPVYNKKGLKYTYTIKEEENNDIGQYQKITYDQTTLTVTNELTEKPKVTLYFTVKNGYTTHDTDEVKFDSEGLTEILKKYDLNPENEYIYEFELENTETKKVYKGNLSTQGILEFSDLPYGTYRALQKDDEYFDFVKMINLEDVPGVKFTEDATGGIIEIEPTGEDIIYGVNIVNKITMPVKNVDTDTGSNIIIIMIIGIITAAIMRYLFLAKKQIS